MYNYLLLNIVLRTVPILTIIFVSIIFMYKIYFSIRSKFKANVNCWFCNFDTRVPYLKRNSWYCPKCEQYNGFNKDGDYNCDLTQQRESSLNKSNSKQYAVINPVSATTVTSINGFCDACNEAQRLKIEKLAQFVPKHEADFDNELKIYKEQIEQQYRLCRTCEYHLNNVLHEKKKMVLGSKLFDYIMKGRNYIEHNKYNYCRYQKLIKMIYFVRLISLLTGINILCSMYNMPHLKCDQFSYIFGATIGHTLFLIYSHVLTILHIFKTYLISLGQMKLIGQIRLFAHTLYMMLLYTLDMRTPYMNNLSFDNIFCNIYPFAMLGLNLCFNIYDGLKFTRFTVLLAYWSAYATGLFGQDNTIVMFLSSIITFILSTTVSLNTAIEQSIEDVPAHSFHKLCADQSDATNSILSISNHSDYSPYQHPQCKSTYDFNCRQNITNKSPLSQYNSSNLLASPNYASSPNYGHIDRSAPPPRFLFAARPSLYQSNIGFLNRAGNRSPLCNMYLNNSFSTSYSPTTSNGFQTFAGCTAQQTSFVPLPLHSPFTSYSNHTAAYQQPQSNQQQRYTSRLLSPSRFNASHNDINAWVANSEIGFNSNIIGHQNGTHMPLSREGNISRTSSLSSGFESQHNAIGRYDNVYGFESMQSSMGGGSMTDLFSNYNGNVRPVNTEQFGWNKYASIQLGCNNGNMATAIERDTFNLQKMNEHLPTIKRGDLLRKWQENRSRDIGIATNSTKNSN